MASQPVPVATAIGVTISGTKPRSTVAPRYLYEEIYADLIRRIRDGEFPPGSQLPSRKQLAEYYKASTLTIDTAMRKLRDEGWTTALHGKGVYVREELPETP